MQCGLPLGRPERQRFRRTVTILFADLVGSTALGERLDPEALAAVLTRYFETRTLVPFAIYCLAAGTASLLWLTLR